MTAHVIKFEGFLKEKYGKEAKVAGATMWHVMQGLTYLFGPEFREDIRRANWHILVGNKKAKKDLGEEDLGLPLKDRVLHLIPAVAGASAGIRIVIGAILVVVGLYIKSPWLVQIGAAMVFGGVAEIMLRKKQGENPSDKADEKSSDIYNGPVNITEQGVPVPIIYGRVSRASSVVISSDFSSEEVAVNSNFTSTYTPPYPSRNYPAYNEELP